MVRTGSHLTATNHRLSCSTPTPLSSSFVASRSGLGARGILGRPKVVRGTADWLSELKRAGVKKLYLATELPVVGDLPPHLASAFANGGGWGLLAVGRRVTLWTCKWTVGDQDAPDSRIWDLDATSVAADGVSAPTRDVSSCAGDTDPCAPRDHAVCRGIRVRGLGAMVRQGDGTTWRLESSAAVSRGHPAGRCSAGSQATRCRRRSGVGLRRHGVLERWHARG